MIHPARITIYESEPMKKPTEIRTPFNLPGNGQKSFRVEGGRGREDGYRTEIILYVYTGGGAFVFPGRLDFTMTNALLDGQENPSYIMAAVAQQRGQYLDDGELGFVTIYNYNAARTHGMIIQRSIPCP